MNIEYMFTVLSFAIVAIVSISHKDTETSLKAIDGMTSFTSKAIDVIRKMFNKK